MGLTKVCNRCGGDPQPLSDFPKDKQKADGTRNHCKRCHTAEQMTRYYANPEPTLKRCKEWRKNNGQRRLDTDKRWRVNNPAKHILQRTRTSAKVSGLDFDLTLEDIVIPEVCPVFGVPLQVNEDPKKRPPNSPSIDRIDPNKGYVRGNIKIISFRANRLKQNATVEELEAIVAYMKREATHDRDDRDRPPDQGPRR